MTAFQTAIANRDFSAWKQLANNVDTICLSKYFKNPYEAAHLWHWIRYHSSKQMKNLHVQRAWLLTFRFLLVLSKSIQGELTEPLLMSHYHWLHFFLLQWLSQDSTLTQSIYPFLCPFSSHLSVLRPHPHRHKSKPTLGTLFFCFFIPSTNFFPLPGSLPYSTGLSSYHPASICLGLLFTLISVLPQL